MNGLHAALALLVLAAAASAQVTIGVRVEASVGATAILDQDVLGAQAHLEAFDAYGVTVTDLDGNGAPELALMGDTSRAYLIDLASRRIVAEAETKHPGARAWHTQTLNGVTVADLDRDGAQELLVMNTGGYLTVLEHEAADDEGADDAAGLERLGLRSRWSVLVDPPTHDPKFWGEHPWLKPSRPEDRTHLVHSAAVVAAPRAGAGEHERWVFVQSDDLPGHFAFDGAGKLMWLEAWQDGHSAPWVGELAGVQTALFATDAGEVVARRADTGQQLWLRKVDRAVANPGSHSVGPVVADLDGDGDKEVFVAARVAVAGHGDWMHRQHAQLDLLDEHGAVVWSVQHPQGNPMVHSKANLHDVDADGTLDLVVLDWNSIGHKPGDFERLGPGRLFALSGANGSVLWTADVDAPTTDFDVPVRGTGADAIAYVPHTVEGEAGIAGHRLSDGTRASWTPLGPAAAGWTVTRGVTLVELDGRLTAAVAVHRDAPKAPCTPKQDIGCREGALLLVPLEAPAQRSVPPAAPQTEQAQADEAPASLLPQLPRTWPVWVGLLAGLVAAGSAGAFAWRRWN